jgi:hypothetical protein
MLKHRLAREVAVVVAVKTAIVILAAFFVFGAAQRPAIDSTAVERHLMASPAASAVEKELP